MTPYGGISNDYGMGGGGYNYSNPGVSYEYNEWGFSTSSSFNLRSSVLNYASMPAVTLAPAATSTTTTPAGSSPDPADPVSGITVPPPVLPAGVTATSAEGQRLARQQREDILEEERDRRAKPTSWWGGLTSLFSSRPIPASLRGNDAETRKRREALEASRRDSNKSFLTGMLWGIVKTVAITAVAAVVVTAAAAAIGVTGGLATPLVVGLVVLGAGLAIKQIGDGLEAKDKAEKKIETIYVDNANRREAVRQAMQVTSTESFAAGDETGQGTAGLVLSAWTAGKMTAGAVAAARSGATVSTEGATIARSWTNGAGSLRNLPPRVPPTTVATSPPTVPTRWAHIRTSVGTGFGTTGWSSGIAPTMAVAPAVGTSTTKGVTYLTSTDPELRRIQEEEGLVAPAGTPVAAATPQGGGPTMSPDQVQAHYAPILT